MHVLLRDPSDLPWLDEQIARERDARVQDRYHSQGGRQHYLQFCRDRLMKR